MTTKRYWTVGTQQFDDFDKAKASVKAIATSKDKGDT